LILRKLLSFRFARLAEFPLKDDFGSFDMQTRYSDFTPTTWDLLAEHH
jgi:hypothetical protein